MELCGSKVQLAPPHGNFINGFANPEFVYMLLRFQKLKAPSFHTTEFSYINFLLQNIDQIFGFWVWQSLKSRRNTCFREFKSSLAVNFHVPKPEKLAFSKMWTSMFCLQKMSIWQRLLANQLGGFEYNFRFLKWFFRKLPGKLRLAFFLKLRFLKIRLLVLGPHRVLNRHKILGPHGSLGPHRVMRAHRVLGPFWVLSVCH